MGTSKEQGMKTGATGPCSQTEEELKTEREGTPPPRNEVDSHSLIQELEACRAELEKQNAELRHARDEAESAKRDVESFSYTVSHDLRSYLNNIYGFVQVMQLESCAEQLDEQCRSHIANIKMGCERMTRLIDTLLNFFRMTKTELNMEHFSFSNMASGIATEFKASAPERKCVFLISEGVSALGDPSLLRIALANLIGNAWKYSAAKEESVIEFGLRENNGNPAYFVRDNGVGFDMAKAGKLFTPFHRLENQERFTGNGIGLATVERIISRHGGRVWFDSEPGNGATFFFTLSDN